MGKKKPYFYTELSLVKRCKTCGRPLKKNLLAKKPDADKCYSCFKGKARKEANEKNP